MNRKIRFLVLTIGVAVIIVVVNFYFNRLHNDLYKLEKAIKENDTNLVNTIINNNKNLVRERIGSLTLLHIATMNRNVAAIKILIDNGADINAKGGRHNYTPIFNSSGLGDIGAMKILIEHGANVNARDDFGETPLMAAAEWGRTKSIRLLIDNNANINAASSSVAGNKTAIWYAVSEGYLDAFLMLKKNGAKYNGGTLIHLAEGKMMKLAKDNKKIKEYKQIIAALESE